MTIVRNLSRFVEDHLRRKGFFRMSPDQRRELAESALRQLEESYPGDPQAALDAIESMRGRGNAT